MQYIGVGGVVWEKSGLHGIGFFVTSLRAGILGIIYIITPIIPNPNIPNTSELCFNASERLSLFDLQDHKDNEPADIH